MFTTVEIQHILDSIKYHYTMMIFTSLGEESLSDEDRFFLEAQGVNIEAFKLQYPPYLQMFLLGRLTSILKDQQLKMLTSEDFNKYIERGQFVPLSAREREEYSYSLQKSYNHLKGLGGKITSMTKDVLLEENKKQIISQEISEGVKNRKSIASVISQIGHKTEEWDRDWKRIVVTEMQDIYNQGKASDIAKKYGDEALVYKQVYGGACRHCIELYLTNGIGSEPRVFKLSNLIANGNNLGLKVAEWKPIVGATHPHCRCDLRVVFKNQVWNLDKEEWEYRGDHPKKVLSMTQTKVTIGDKEFMV